MHVLLVEDDERVASFVEQALYRAGHRLSVARDGPSGLAQGARDLYDLIVLDVLLPGLDGLVVCHELRRQGVRTPILMLTARDAVSDRVRGLDAGADDYLTKPFAMEELLARVRALGRRGTDAPPDTLKTADLTLDPARHEVWRGDVSIELTPREFDLLAYLMRNAGRVVTRDQILGAVWGHDADVAPKMVELYIHYLRNKIDRATSQPLVRTIRGVGYMVDG